MTALTLSPDAVVRFKGGRAVIHNPYSPEAALQTEDGAVVALVSRFARPADPAAVLQSLPAQFRTAAENLIQKLILGGVLVSAPAAAAARPRAFPDALNGLRTLAQSVHELAGDAMALGEAGAAKVRASGIGLDQRVLSLLAAVDGLREELGRAREALLAGQLEAVKRKLGERELKLHIGAGEHAMEGWVNVDVAPADLTLNLRWGLPFATGAARLIHAAHVLEHLYYPEEALGFLRECRRVLRPGGRLRVVVPDIEQCIRAYCSGDRAFFEERRRTWKDWPAGRTPLADFLAYAGAGPRPAQFVESHKYGYDWATLEQALKQAGFLAVARSTFQGSSEPDLRVDRSSAVAGATHGEEHYSLFVEATA